MELDSTLSPGPSRIVAVLGPTNTGKTHIAMERMLGHPTGMIGFPLRLLARENYDRAVDVKGRGAVALITGEEKILPPGARYFLCTVEAMESSRPVSFLAVDEIQMCADPDRGHIFTDRLLHARGTHETMFMGAETIRPLLKHLVPHAALVSRPRFSTLSHVGSSKLSRLPPRTAIVAFSMADVYAVAELIRRERGGTAIVVGALSPRTRNAQVALFQSGEVDYLVATDAIGMGLNLSVDHVAFVSTCKFDGRLQRRLTAAELAQIAGRAGRYTRDGTFGTTADLSPLDPETAERIETHRFDPLPSLVWRSRDLRFDSLNALKASLACPAPHWALRRARPADDELALATLERDPEVRARAVSRDSVRLLWDVCRIPDFGRVMTDGHAQWLSRVFHFLAGGACRGPGRLPPDWVARQVERINRTDGDIETLMQRLANIRIWTYVAHRCDWLDDATHWQERTRAIEDKLSDTLHERLVQRFVDRRAASLYLRVSGRQRLTAVINDAGEVLVEGHHVGLLNGLRFIPDPSVAGAEVGGVGRTVTAAAGHALRTEIATRLRRLEMAEDRLFCLDQQGIVSWAGAPIARLTAGPEPLRPRVEPLGSDLVGPAETARLRRRLDRWLDSHLRRELPALYPGHGLPESGAVRGLVFQLAEGLGYVEQTKVMVQLAGLTAADRAWLQALGVRRGRTGVYIPALLKPKPMALRALLWAIHHRRTPKTLEAGGPSLRVTGTDDGELMASMGYRQLGPRWVRVDILERAAAQAERVARAQTVFFPGAFCSSIGCTVGELPLVLAALGYRPDSGEGGLRLVAVRRPRVGRRKAEQRRRRILAADANSPFATLRQLRSTA